MAIEKDWDTAFRHFKTGSKATCDRAWRTWTAVRKFGGEKKWDLAPGTITAKQVRIYLEHRATVISPRCVQNEASHLRRALRGAGQDVPDKKTLRLDKQNPWSSARLKVAPASRVGGKVAADSGRWAEAKAHMPRDILAVVGLVEVLGLRCREGVMSGESLREWSRELNRPEIKNLGCYIHLHTGSKGGRPRHIFIPASRLEAVQKAVDVAKSVTASNKDGFLVDAADLERAMKRYSNCMSRLGLVGDDSGHGLRRAWAQDQFAFYREGGMVETEALRRLSNDLGHGDGRGRWVWNNYLMGGSA